MKTIKTLKTIQVITIFTLMAFLQLGCNERKVEQHHHFQTIEGKKDSETGSTNTISNTQLGGETHGGDVLYARAEEIRFLLTASEEEINNRYLSQDQHQYIRKYLVNTFQSLQYFYDSNSVKEQSLEKALTLIFDHPSAGDLYKNLENLKFRVLMPPKPGEEKLLDFMAEKCKNIEGKVSTAAAKLNDPGGEICVDAGRLAQEAPELKDMVSLISHEILHQYGANDETDPVVLQNYIMANFDFLNRFAEKISLLKKDGEFLDFSNQNFPEKPLKISIKAISNSPYGREVLVGFLDLDQFASMYAIPPSYTTPIDLNQLSSNSESIERTFDVYPSQIKNKFMVVEVRAVLDIEFEIKIGDITIAKKSYPKQFEHIYYTQNYYILF